MFTGKIVNTTSEPINGAPVLVEIETADGIEVVPFERRLWNDFFFAHEATINTEDFRVVVFGELFEQMVVCMDEDCEACEEEDFAEEMEI